MLVNMLLIACHTITRQPKFNKELEYKQEMSSKKDKRRRIKNRRKYNTRLSTCPFVHKSYTVDRKLKMNIVKWTAVLANFVTK